MTTIPLALKLYLPKKTLSVHAFLALALPPIATANRQMRPEKYVSTLAATTTTVEEICHLLPPPTHIVNTLMDRIKDPKIQSIECPHEPTAGGKRFPLFTVQYWARLLASHDTQAKWRLAVDELQAWMQNEGSPILGDAYDALSHLPWSGRLHQGNSSIDIPALAAFFTREWLTDDHELIMLELLKDDLIKNGHNDILIENTAFALLLTAAYVDKQNYAMSRHYTWLRERGEALANGQKSCLATVVNRDNTHWVATIIDARKREVLYGDSFGSPIRNDLKQVLDWWMQYHTDKRFQYRNLPVSIQNDTYSCGVLSWDALRCHLVCGGDPKALLKPGAARDERLQIFLRLASNHSLPGENIGSDDTNTSGHSMIVDSDVNTLSTANTLSSSFIFWPDDVITTEYTPSESRASLQLGFLDSSDDYRVHSSNSGSLSDSGGDDDDDYPPYKAVNKACISIPSTQSTLTSKMPLAPDRPTIPLSCKRGHDMSEDSKTKPSKRVRTQATSSIRKGLQGKAPCGLLQYFRKATETEHRAHLERMEDEVSQKAEELTWQQERQQAIMKQRRQERATQCKRKERTRKKEAEILNGTRSPGGTKKTKRDLKLEYTPKIDMGGSVAELSRPARDLNKKFLDERRKPQGRKPKGDATRVKYHNWMTPFLFKQIENARIFAGGPHWSTRAIVHVLRRDTEKHGREAR